MIMKTSNDGNFLPRNPVKSNNRNLVESCSAGPSRMPGAIHPKYAEACNLGKLGIRNAQK
jgi:hypothetical protein